MKTVRDFICVMIIFALLSGLCVCLATNDAELAGEDNELVTATDALITRICTTLPAYVKTVSQIGVTAVGSGACAA